MPSADCTNCILCLNAALLPSGVVRGVRLLCVERERERERVEGEANELVCECFRDSHSLKGSAFKKHTHTHTHTRTHTHTERSEAV